MSDQHPFKGVLLVVTTWASAIITWLPILDEVLRFMISVLAFVTGIYSLLYYRKKSKLIDKLKEDGF